MQLWLRHVPITCLLSIKKLRIAYGEKRKFLFSNPEKTIERIHREKEKQKPTLQNMEDCSKLSLKKH